MARSVDGISNVLSNLNKEIGDIQGRTRGGLLAAGLKISRLSKQRVPREYSTLFTSGYARPAKGDPDVVEVGFSADYAWYVHENMEQKLKGQPRPSGLGVYWGPHGQPKYLESAIVDLHDEIIKTIRDRARVT